MSTYIYVSIYLRKRSEVKGESARPFSLSATECMYERAIVSLTVIEGRLEN